MAAALINSLVPKELSRNVPCAVGNRQLEGPSPLPYLLVELLRHTYNRMEQGRGHLAKRLLSNKASLFTKE